MSDSMRSDPSLPPELESRVMEILELDDHAIEPALEELYRAHPEHETRIRARLHRVGEFIELADGAFDATVAGADPDDTLPRFDQYEIVSVLGRGGMGTVYLAEQMTPVCRRVAIKVIRLGMDSKVVLQRFELERRALAMMNHDCIARVFDADTTDRGQPFFVMEHVPGLPLTEYCDRHRLTLEDRIRLFQQVCAGVQYAHQKGVIHRDLKPGNVLVSEESGRAVPKIIDFGLVRATDATDIGTGSLHTVAGQMIGTPEYMSPEQADATVADLDTRTDIYSLGVMLYELLVGDLPFGHRKLREGGLAEMQRVIRDIDPPRPSEKLSSVGDTGPAVSRRTTVEVLRRALTRDLDWVVLKAMHKDRERRYESAAALAAELDRYLRHEPVLAGPPSAAYRIAKFARRYRAQVIGLSAVFITAITGAVVAIQYARSAIASEKDARDEGKRAQQKADEVRQRKAEFDELANVTRLEEAIRVEKTFRAAWPDQVQDLDDWLRNYAEPLRAALPELRRTVAGLEARSVPRTEAEELAEREAHPLFPELLRKRGKLATYRRTLAVREGREQVEEPELPQALADADAVDLNRLAWGFIGRFEGNWGNERLALAAARRAFELAVGEEKAYAGRNLAWSLQMCGLHDDALPIMEQAVELATAPRVKAVFASDLAALKRILASWRVDARGLVDAVAAEVEQLERQVSDRRHWRFDDEAQRYLCETLRSVIGKIEAFQHTEVPRVERRLFWAERIEELTLNHPNARVSWEEARQAVGRADGVTASTLYGDHPLELVPQTGLVPIGMNPVTKLWEFYHLRSAWDGSADPRGLEIPQHAPDGTIPVGTDTGIVFVLVPGGSFRLGAQAVDPDAPNYDRLAFGIESPVHSVRLDPFLLARHEITQAQWVRLGDGENPSHYLAGKVRSSATNQPITAAHPVESVDWWDSDRLLSGHGLTLPTEAQWEYACRAGSDSAWPRGDDATALDGVANVMDQWAKRHEPTWSVKPVAWSDGFTIHCPVDALAADAWGFHHMLGNVWEWCRDGVSSYRSPVRKGTGLRELMIGNNESAQRIRRGGSFLAELPYARPAYRGRDMTERRSERLGARAARVVQRVE